MKQQVQLPYSDDMFIVEAELVKRLYNLPIVRISIRGQSIALTPDIATMIGEAMIDVASSMDEPRPVKNIGLYDKTTHRR